MPKDQLTYDESLVKVYPPTERAIKGARHDFNISMMACSINREFKEQESKTSPKRKKYANQY